MPKSWDRDSVVTICPECKLADQIGCNNRIKREYRCLRCKHNFKVQLGTVRVVSELDAIDAALLQAHKAINVWNPPARVCGPTEKLGSTVFADGIPHIECGVCGTAHKLFDGVGSVRFTHSAESFHGKSMKTPVREVKPYLVNIGYWHEEEIISVDADGIPTIETVRRPRVWRASACFPCWNEQQKLQREEKARYEYVCTKPVAKGDKSPSEHQVFFLLKDCHSKNVFERR